MTRVGVEGLETRFVGLTHGSCNKTELSDHNVDVVDVDVCYTTYSRDYFSFRNRSRHVSSPN